MQMGVISPTKLRMKLLGSHGGGGGKDEATRKSPRASPSRLDDADHPKNSLLAQELDEGEVLWRVRKFHLLRATGIVKFTPVACRVPQGPVGFVPVALRRQPRQG
jgi:hypothetical protein